MANPTTNYSFAMPTNTDLVKDLPADFEVFGQAVDTTIKALNPETTLGDISYRSSTANTNTRLAIGTTGQVLTVNGGVPSWATPGSSVPANSSATVTTSETTTSTTYTDLATSGPAVTVTTGTKALVIVTANLLSDSGNSAYMSYAVSGATTISAADTVAARSQIAGNNYPQSVRFSAASVATLTAGSNTFTAKYRNAGNTTNTYSNREIFVINLA